MDAHSIRIHREREIVGLENHLQSILQRIEKSHHMRQGAGNFGASMEAGIKVCLCVALYCVGFVCVRPCSVFFVILENEQHTMGWKTLRFSPTHGHGRCTTLLDSDARARTRTHARTD